jgi:dynein heavy chain
MNGDDIKKRPEHGCYLTGLYLEGAGWDMEKGLLRKQNPKELICPMPIIQIVPIEANKLKLKDNLRTPVYVTQSRRNAMGVGLVFEADLQTKEHPSHWVLQGVALVLNIDI